MKYMFEVAMFYPIPIPTYTYTSATISYLINSAKPIASSIPGTESIMSFRKLFAESSSYSTSPESFEKLILSLFTLGSTSYTNVK